ncbi:MAG: acetylornithine deacetylase [Acidobacteria bacterium]|nr:MAG: acetylornithine deacetylase [Acidobacteriota bacterium]
MISFQKMDASHINHTLKELRSDAIGLLQDLVRIQSITGNENSVQQYLAEHLKSMKLDVDEWNPMRKDLENHAGFSDDGLPLGERPVLVARWKGVQKEARSIILNGHVDVVPVGDENAWIDGPWSGAYREDQVWGRGSCDMKGGLVSGIIAIQALQKLGVNPRGDVILQSVIGEETGGVGTLAAVLRGYRADAAIVLEPTRMAICPVGAGAASFRLHIPGRAAHGAMRKEGVSAVEKFYLIYSALQELESSRHSGYRHPCFQQEELVAPLSVGKIAAGDWPSTVPESLIAEGRYGVLPGENMKAAKSEFERTVQIAAESDTWLCEHRPVVEWFEGQFEPAET